MKSILVFFIFISTLYGHSGRTDSDGGHYNRSTGEYHYHNGGYDYQATMQSHYVISMFQYKTFMGLGNTYSTKAACMQRRYDLWVKFRDKGWTYGCRKTD